MTAYLTVQFDIIDRPEFDDYVEKVQPFLGKYDAKLVIGDYAPRAFEGGPRGMNVVMRFPSEDAALAFYNDPEYEPLKQQRLAATTNHSMLLSPGVEEA